MTGSFPEDIGHGAPACPCWHSGANYRQFSTFRTVGVDVTHSRFAEVWVWECRDCHMLWLNYFVEYEGFSNSGRWARSVIGRPEAETISPEEATAHLERSDYAYGGSYFDGVLGWRHGPMHWGV